MCDLSVISSDQLMRQSFDRFDDKLVENILTYLTFSEKVLFESVSKQFKRCVYRQQKRIVLKATHVDDNDFLDGLLVPLEVSDYTTGFANTYGIKRINKFWLKSLFQKWKTLETFDFECFLDFEDLDMIFINSPNVKSVKFEAIGLNADDLEQLGTRYGHLIEKAEFHSSFLTNECLNKFLIHCKNLKEFVTRDFSGYFLQNESYLPKLERIKSYHVSSKSQENKEQVLNKFDKFCDKYSPTLTEFDVSIECNSLSQTEVESLVTSMNKIKHLKRLSCLCHSIECVDKLIAGLSPIGINDLHMFIYCPKLRIDRIINSFQDYNCLEKLDLYFRGWNVNPSLTGNVESLSSSKNFKELRIGAGSVSEDFFQGIGQHLPDLEHLYLRTESDITDKTIVELSQLKNLKDFYFNKSNNFNEFITDESVCALIEGCPHLKQLKFGSRPNITDKTIETLINCANIYPKKELHFECGQTQVGGQLLVNPIKMSKFIDKIPNNLIILFE